MTKSTSTFGNGKGNGKGKAMAAATVAAVLAGALTVGSALPALAEEAAPDECQQQPIVVQDDATADEGAWDATADENGFGADATATYAPELAAAQGDLDGAAGCGWWRCRVSPTDALSAAEEYFSIWDFGDWNYQIGRFRGIPAYRIEIDGVDDYAPWGQRRIDLRSVAFVDYFTGEVIDGYSELE